MCGIQRKEGRGFNGNNGGGGGCKDVGRAKKLEGVKLKTRSPEARRGMDTSDVIAGALLIVCARFPFPIKNKYYCEL